MSRNAKENEPDVEQLFHAIARRDPSKRQIKPVSSTAQLELFDELDDDSDSEFVCEDQEDEDSEVEDSDSVNNSTASSNESDSSVEDAEKPVFDDVSNGASEKPSNQGCKEPVDADEQLDISCDKPEEEPLSLQDSRDDIKVRDVGNSLQSSVGGEPTFSGKKLADFLVCAVCLGDHNDPNDELIECDGCGIVVHEECYKVVDSIFLSSGASSSSTDAWFCEPCLVGVRFPFCELCPNLFGAFKRTDNNRWVHLVCALYTPGVAFNDPEDLMGVTLTELPPKCWASHECSLCDERFFAWTGVCIECDAGLCRTYFHATCAQKHGLLSEPAVDENAADPYFAHCRQHTDKAVARQRRRNFLAALSRYRWKRGQLSKSAANQLSPRLMHSPDPITPVHDTAMQLEPRLQRKLDQFRELYEELLKSQEKPYVPNTKTPLLLEHSPIAMRLFVTKAKRLQLPLELTGQSALTDSSKVPSSGYPVFSPDFISYFFDREKKIAEVLKHISSLQNTQRELQISDASASHSYNSVSSQFDIIISKRNELRSQVNRILSSVNQLIPELKPSALLEPLFEEALPNSEVQSGIDHCPLDDQNKNITRFGRIPVRKSTYASSEATQRGVKRRGTALGSLAGKYGVLADDERHSIGTPTENVILECFFCHGLQDQHLITKCDTCSKAFHLACLDPPLSRMPKRSRLYGWQCSFCTKAVASNSEVVQVDVNAPRQLRRSISRSSGGTGGPSAEPSVKTVKTCDDAIVKPDQSAVVTPKLEPVIAEPKIITTVVTSNTKQRRSGSTGMRLAKNRTTGSRRSGAFGLSGSAARGAMGGGRRQIKSSLGTPRYIPAPTRRTARRSAPSIFKSRTQDTNLSVQPTILITQLDSSQCTTSKSSEVTDLEAKSFDAYEYRTDANSDEEMTRLRSSKVIKFEQIRDHSRISDSESVEQIAPLNLRYIICRDSNGVSQKKSTPERFRVKLKKL